MRSTLGQDQENGVYRQIPQQQAVAAAVSPTAKEIPYDYVAKFKLEGRPGNRVQDVINISIDGAFVAVAIGYSFIPAKLPDLAPPPTPILMLAPSPSDTLNWVLSNVFEPVVKDPRMLTRCLLVRLCGIDFRYSIVDSATGRELQNQPIHNIAGLGESTGDRPFRPFAKPMLFMPRSTIRIEIEEISEGPLYGYEDPITKQRFGAELYFVLHGYKILGYGTSLP
jgi:hypothetical protein